MTWNISETRSSAMRPALKAFAPSTISSWSGSKKKKEKEFFRLYDKFHLYQRWNRQYGKFHRNLGIRRVELRSLSFYLAWFHHFSTHCELCSTYARTTLELVLISPKCCHLTLDFFALYDFMTRYFSALFWLCVCRAVHTLCVWNEKCEKSSRAKSTAFDTMRPAIYSCSWDRT